ncbi:DUF2752 domain-containing protein [Cronbergia sp. UHCC 0137]|uniref:DUF2752 domain-containing protein n=1 Tax=Cronbergia sp. UHCC 0137 TaxID=3110239 RepID=UPI002B214F27|nr:DUF2752 domain-containing protein [Cronbergia sp. UHCC 0137]MEA5616453.1 DUF2752 domain-containing protein [Cronbergia sp. UHCC 0137]
MLKLSSQILSFHGKVVRWGILGFCSTPLIGSYFYIHGYRISFLVCPIRHFTGIPCPTCGMTRSFMAVAQGDWNQAFIEHLFGPVLFISFAIIVIHISLELLINRRITTFYSRLLPYRKLQIFALGSLLVYHGFRLYNLSQSSALYYGFINSPLARIISLYGL